MCEPVTIALAATAVIGAAASAASAAQQSKQANEAATEGNDRYRSVSDAALDDYKFNLGQLGERSAQEGAAASQAAIDNQQQGQAAIGQVAANAAARGVSGNSVNALLNEFGSIEAENSETITRNRDWSETALRNQEEGLQSEAQSRISGAAPSRIYGPSSFGLALDIAGQGLKGYSTYLKAQPPAKG